MARITADMAIKDFVDFVYELGGKVASNEREAGRSIDGTYGVRQSASGIAPVRFSGEHGGYNIIFSGYSMTARELSETVMHARWGLALRNEIDRDAAVSEGTAD